MSEFRIKVNVDLETSDIDKQLKELNKDYEIKATVDMSNIKKQIQDIKKSFKEAFKFTSKDLGGLDKLIKTLAKINNGTADGKNSVKNVTNLVSEYKNLSNTVSKLQKQVSKGGLGEDSLQRTQNQIEKIKSEMKSLYKEMTPSQKEAINIFNLKNETKELVEFNDKLNKIETTATSLQTHLKGLSLDHIDTDIVSRLQNELKEIKDLTNNMDISFDADSLGDLLTILSRIQSEIKNLEKVENLASSFDKIVDSASKVGIEIKDLDGVINNLASEAKDLDGSFDRTFSEAKNGASELKSELKEVSSTMNKVSKESKKSGGILGTMDDFKGNFSQFTLAEVAGDFIADGIRTAVGGIKDTVVETDSAIRDLQKVYGKLESNQLKDYLLDVTEVAKGTGQSSVDVIQATAKAVQSGIKDLDEAMKYAEKVAIFSNVGDVDQSQADTIVASIMSAYGGVENSLKPVRENIKGMSSDYSTLAKFTDLANYAGNNFAVSTADVGIALQQSAAALQANGVSMEESVGMVVAMNEVLQDSSKAGNALKSISSSLAGVGVSAKDGTLQTNKTAKALKEIANIDVWDKQTGQIKDMYQVMEELSSKWDSLSEAEQNALGSAIAGKTQLNAFNALISNWEKARQLVSDYKQGLTIGSAEKENAEYLDSIEGKWNKIKENLKSVVTSLITSDSVKGFLDILIKITDKLAELASTDIGKNAFGLGAIVASLGAIGGVVSKLTGVTKFIKTLSTVGKTASTISTVATTLGKLGGSATVAGQSAGGVSALAKALGAIGGTAGGITAAAIAVVGLATAIGDSTKTMDKLQDSTKGSLGIGDAVASGSEMMNGFMQMTLGNKGEVWSLIGKEFGALFSGNWSEFDDIFNESMAKIRTNTNEAVSDMTASTSTSLQLMKESTQEELSGVKNIYDNVFSELPDLTYSGINEMSSTLADGIHDMSADNILIAKGMGGEIGATLFQGIHEGMSKSEMKKKFQSNLKTLINSKIINEQDVNKTVEEFNKMYDKALDGVTGFKQGSSNVFNQLKEGLKVGDLKNATKDASKEMDKWTNEMIEKQKSAGKAWSAVLDGVTEEMSDKERQKRMQKNMKEFMKVYDLDEKEFENMLRSENIELHANIDAEVEAELNAEEAKTQIQQQFEDLDIETRAKFAVEFAGADDEQLAVIYNMLQQFPPEVQTKLKGEGFKEVLMESESTLDFLQKLPEEKLVELVSDTKFIGALTPEELEMAVSRIPDEKLAQLLVKTDYLNSLSPEQLAIMLEQLPEEKRIELCTQYVNSGKRTPEQIATALQTLPEEEIVKIITEYKENGGTLEQIEMILQSLPPEVRTVIRAMLVNAGVIEGTKEDVEELDKKEANPTIEVKKEGEEPKQTSEELDELDKKDVSPEINVTSNGEEMYTTKEDMDKIDGMEANPKIKPIKEGNEPQETREELEVVDSLDSNPTVNVKSNDEELEKTKKNLDETDGKKAEATVEVKTTLNGNTTSSSVEGMYTDKNALLKAVGLPETASQTVEVEAKVTGVDTSGVAQVEIKPIEIEALVSDVDTTALSNITVDPIKISAEADMTTITGVQTALNSIQDKTVKILADGSNATLKITNITTGLASIQDKTVKILADSSNATLKITNVTTGLTNIKDKTVKILADSSNAMMKIANVKAGLAGIKDKTVTIKANASQAISAINSVKSALAGVKSKTVSVNVNKTTTNKTVNLKSTASAKSTPMLSNSSLASVPVSASSDMVTASDTPSLANTSVSASANNAFGGTLDANKILSSLDFDVSHIKNLEEALERLGNQLDLIDEKSEAVFGQEKVDLLQQQIPLLKEQQRIQEQIAKNERAQNNELIAWLNNQGFTFDNLGNVTNYNNKLLQMEQNVESLKKKYDDLNSASGDNKNEEAIKSANKSYESANETLSKTKKYLEEYFTTNNQELIEASKKWWEYENAIRDAEQAINDVNNALLENKIDAIADEIDFLDAKMENLNSQDKIRFLGQQNDLYREQQKLLHQLAEQMRAQLSLLDPLSEEYAELSSTIKGLSTEWWDLENSITDNQMSIFEEQSRGARNEVDRLGDEIDFLDAKMSAYSGVEKIEIIRQQNALYKEQQNALHVLAEQLRAQLSLMDVASQEYADLQSEIKGLSTEWWDLEKAIQDSNEEIIEIEKEARKLELEKKLNPLRDSLEDIKYELEGINDQISLLEKIGERAQGAVKIDNLQQQISVLNQKLTATRNEFESINKLRQGLMSELSGKGFSFDADGSIFNYGERLGLLAGSEDYEDIKQLADEYMSLLTDDYNENKENIIDIQNTIKELQDEIVKAERELVLFSSKNRLTELNEEFEKLSTKIDIIDSKLEYAFGTDKISLMRKEIELLNEQLLIQSKQMDNMTEQMQTYADSLNKYGFTFDSDGSISNYAEIMDKFRDDEQVENIKDLCDEYMDLCKEVKNLTSEYVDLESAVKDAYNEMLDTTKEIEDEITDVIKKEYEERQKEVEDYTNERIKMLEKEKQAMQDLWDNQDYEKSVEEQSKEIMELQKRINILMGDTSIAGQQKLKELTEELEDAQKELEKLTEDKIREDYSNNIDKEIEKLEEEEQSILEALEENFSDKKIAEIVQQALTSGFIELNGEIQSVQDVLINSINESAEGYSVMAEVIKNQLVANLNVALSTTKELSDIYKNLDLNEYGKISALENIAISTPNVSSGASNVTFGDTIFNVSGSADNTTLEQVEEMIKQSQEEMLDKITRDV